MAKRYLNLDEAAAKLGMTKDELNRLRTKGEIRGFSDRGTFKFKEEDVEELGRRLQPSSDPDVQMIGEDDASVLDDEPAADGSGLDGAPSIIRRLSGGEPGSESDSGDSAGSIFDDFGAGGASDSDVRLVMDDRLDSGHDSGPDVMLQLQESDSDVRLSSDSGRINLNDSDSDVRLAMDGPTAEESALNLGLSDSDSDVRLDDDRGARFSRPDSDSDVQLAPDAAGSGKLAPKPDSDSDVMLVSEEPDSDSDVHLADEDSGLPIGMQSDSDVQLIGADSDSDVRLLDDARVAGPKSRIKKDSDSDVAVLPDSGVNLTGGSGIGPKSGTRGAGSSVLMDDSDIALDGGSGISLTSQSGINLTGPQSGISLDRVADSGVSLEKRGQDVDSGLSLFEDDDEGGITLAGDSGIALQMSDDSGIALSGDDDEDAGITLADIGTDSGISLKDDDGDLRLTETMPAMKIPKGSKGKKKPADDEEGMGDTMLEVPSLDLQEEEEAGESDFEIGSVDGGSTGDTSVLLFDDEDETDDGGAAMVKKKDQGGTDDEDAFEFSDGDEEEAVAESEETEDVFAGDEAFEEDSEFGESEAEFDSSAAKAAVGAPVEYPWGSGVISMLAVSSIVMLLCGMASIDLVRSMWGHQGYSAANGWLIETLGGLFK
ncbi:MAG: hypothetical protein IAG10_06690 [Planctomycetaceae bacterium]|nr:hypothetical protein [Planctomycetaceae bacterium]